MPSDLLSTDARCLVIILGGQCNRPMVDSVLPRDAMLSAVHAIVVCLSVRLQIMPHDRPGTLFFIWNVL